MPAASISKSSTASVQKHVTPLHAKESGVGCPSFPLSPPTGNKRKSAMDYTSPALSSPALSSPAASSTASSSSSHLSSTAGGALAGLGGGAVTLSQARRVSSTPFGVGAGVLDSDTRKSAVLPSEIRPRRYPSSSLRAKVAEGAGRRRSRNAREGESRVKSYERECVTGPACPVLSKLDDQSLTNFPEDACPQVTVRL